MNNTLNLTQEKVDVLNDLGFKWKCRTETTIADDIATNSIKVQVRVENENIFSHEDDGRALYANLPVKTKPIDAREGSDGK